MLLKKLRSYGWNKLFRITKGILTHGLSSYRLARLAITEKEAVQRTWELMSLIGLVRALRPRVVMEIGSYHGGTLFCWPQLATDDAVFISLDLPGEQFDGTYGDESIEKFQSYMKSNQTLQCVRADSHSAETLEEIVRILDGRKIDFLFIDGDHSYEGVRSDFELYAPLVRQGGLVAFHDIQDNPYLPAMQVERFWSEVKTQYQMYEFIDQNKADQYGMGIGVLVQN
jgi:Cephalosporin hydroxylase